MRFRHLPWALAVLAGSAPWPAGAAAQLTLTSLGSPVTVTFTGFGGAGLAPTPLAGQLDSDTWSVQGMSDGDTTWGGTHVSGDLARGASPGGVTTGGLYAFFAAGASNPALGVQPTETDFTPGSVTLRVRNSTGVTVQRVQVSFDAWSYNDSDRAQSFVLQHSTNDVTYVDTSASATTLELRATSPFWERIPFSVTLGGLSLPPSGHLYLRWSSDDAGGTGARDELAIDDITITALASCTSHAECDDGNPCTSDSCSGGVCVHGSRPSGTSCSDGDACNGVELCDGAGSCAPGTALDCDDLDPCTADSCTPSGGCAHAPIGGCGGDAGPGGTDAGAGDGGPAADGGGPGTDGGGPAADAATPETDASPLPDRDAGDDRRRTGRRGGCSAAQAERGGGGMVWVGLLVALGCRRRRRA